MPTAPAQLLWECVKGHNAFIRKGLNGAIFSAEPGNLYNKHSYKFSGIANEKVVDIRTSAEGVVVSKSSTKHSSKPTKSCNSVTMKKKGARINRAVAAEVSGFRPDLKRAAVARASAATKSQRVQAAAVRK